MAYQSRELWSLVGTRMLIGADQGQLQCVGYPSIESIASRDYPPKNWMELGLAEAGRLKTSWKHLLVTAKSGNELVFWVPPGPEAFSLWNILLMLARMAD
ncbi:MAG: hypothetical protein RID07_20405 [Lacipirellulaceae bacterium]